MGDLITRRLFLGGTLPLYGAGRYSVYLNNRRVTLVYYIHPAFRMSSLGTKICGRPDFDQMFPYSLRSATLPVLVHYYKEIELETAQKTLAYVEKGATCCTVRKTSCRPS